jgi:flagellar biogenesis protein FliO
VQQFLAITLVLVLLWGTVWLLRKKGLGLPGMRARGVAQAAHIEHLDRMHLSPQHSVHLLRIDGQKIVVAVHPHGVTVVSELPARGRNELTRQHGDI